LTALAGVPPWHIALTQPGQDRIAEHALRNRRYRVYRPIIPVKVPNRHNGVKTSWRSMFPGYLFVLPLAHGWEMLRTAPGMRIGEQALMKINGRFATLGQDDPEFQRIRRIEQELCTAKLDKPNHRFKRGDEVRVND